MLNVGSPDIDLAILAFRGHETEVEWRCQGLSDSRFRYFQTSRDVVGSSWREIAGIQYPIASSLEFRRGAPSYYL